MKKLATSTAIAGLAGVVVLLVALPTTAFSATIIADNAFEVFGKFGAGTVPNDGTGDMVVGDTAFGGRRGVARFSLAGVAGTLQSATLNLTILQSRRNDPAGTGNPCVSPVTAGSPPFTNPGLGDTNVIHIADPGTPDKTDYESASIGNDPGTLIAAGATPGSLVSIDVKAAMQDRIDSGASFVGFRIQTATETDSDGCHDVWFIRTEEFPVDGGRPFIEFEVAFGFAPPAWADFQAGFDAYQRGDYAAAYREWLPLAEAGDAEAQFNLGILYDLGQGVAQSKVRAATWYRRSAEQGFAAAQYNLAVMFANGEGVPRNNVLAYALFDLAAADDPEAAEQRDSMARGIAAEEIDRALRLADRAREDDTAMFLGEVLGAALPAEPGPESESAGPSPELVRTVQEALTVLGYDAGAADGMIGPRTRAAIRAFQADAELAAEGRVSQRLLAHLEQSMAHTSPPRAPDENPVRLVRAGRKLSLADARILERKLARDPDALWVRGKLLGFYFYKAKRALGAGPTIEARRRHVLWLIRNRPEGRLAGSSEATIDPIGHALADEEGYRQAKELWLQQAEKEKDNIKVLLNAAKFVQLHDKTIAETLLKRAQAPNRLGYLYALGILGINMLSHTGIPTSYDPAEINGEFASKARAELEETSNIALLVSAASTLLQYGTMMKSMLGLELEPDPVDFAEGILNRAQSLSPESQLLGALVPVYRMRWGAASSPEEMQAAATATLKLMESSGFTVFGPKGKLSSDIEFARFAIEADEIDKAEVYASELLAMASADPNASFYGKAIHHGNLVLGRVALRRGNIDSAKEYLIKAGQTPGDGALSSFGPNMALAKELLEAGEKAAVIEYLQLCKSFWDSGRKRGTPDRWIKTIKAGEIPEFGPNLIY